MQHVNDDMDELFRRAAENYPLDTKNADWNKVLNALNNSDDKTEAVHKNRGRFLWLLLLLPLGFICNKLYSPNIGRGTNETAQTSNTQQKDLKKTGSVTRENNSIKAGDNEKHLDNSLVGKDMRKEEKVFQSQKVQKPNLHSYVADGSTNKKASAFFKTEFSGSNISENTLETNETFFTKNVATLQHRRVLLVPAFNGNTRFSQLANPNESIAQNKQQSKKDKKFYIGAFGGMDVTTVKFQKVENKGNSYGFLGGYQFNKKWSIEAGAFWEKKYYYSEGKYFDTKGMYLPNNTKITEVSGDCKMIEIPWTVKYNFASGNNSNWFAALGASSYLMKKEDYRYLYYYTNSGTSAWHNKQYTKSSTNLFSNLGVSGGYEHKIGSIADVRIEPYLKIPLKGMGVGKLPLFSAGLHVGIVKKF